MLTTYGGFLVLFGWYQTHNVSFDCFNCYEELTRLFGDVDKTTSHWAATEMNIISLTQKFNWGCNHGKNDEGNSKNSSRRFQSWSGRMMMRMKNILNNVVINEILTMSTRVDNLYRASNSFGVEHTQNKMFS